MNSYIKDIKECRELLLSDPSNKEVREFLRDMQHWLKIVEDNHRVCRGDVQVMEKISKKYEEEVRKNWLQEHPSFLDELKEYSTL